MKFDSYPRFVKSDLYKMCLVEQIADHLPFNDLDKTVNLWHFPKKKVCYVLY